MRPLALEDHYGNTQQVDLCLACHLVWFDAFESVRLSGLGWAALLRAMHEAMSQQPGVLAAQVACPRCAAVLKPVRNQSRFGRTAALECPKGHGYFQTFSLLLAERGLVRPLMPRDRQVLDREARPLCCLNCGAAVGTLRGDACPHCASALVVFDLSRLMSSLLIRDAIVVPPEQAQHVRWPCRACGAAVDPTGMARCPQCDHAVVAPALDDVMRMVAAVEPVLRAHQAPAPKPHGHWMRRLSQRDTGLYRLFTQYLGLPQAQAAQRGSGLPWRALGVLAVLAALAVLVWRGR